MKKIILILYPLCPNDICIGPSKFARFDGIEALQTDTGGGCVMKMSLYKRIFRETREEVAKEMRRDVTEPEVLAEARYRVRVNRYEPDKKSQIIENSGVLIYDGVQEFTVVDGKARYLNPDGSLSSYSFDTFHERQLSDSNPSTRDAYSEESHHTDILLNSVIVNAKGYIEVTKIAHDSRGVRDLYTYVYNPVTNRGFIRIRNIAPNGKSMSPSEARQKMRQVFAGRQEIQPEQHVSVMVKSKQDIDNAKVQIVYEHVIHKTIETQVRIGKAAYTEAKDTVRSIDGYVQRMYGKKLQDISLMVGDTLIQRVRRMFEDSTKEQKSSTTFQHQLDQRKSVEHMKLKKHDSNLLVPSFERAGNVRQHVQEKIIRSVAALFFVRATGVGIGGTFEYVRTIVQFRQPEDDKKIEKVKVKKHQAKRKIQEKIVMPVSALACVRTTGVGIGGSFVLLESVKQTRRKFREKIAPQIALEQPTRTRKEKQKRQKRREISLKQRSTKEKMRAFRKNERLAKLAKKEQRAFRRKEKLLRRKVRKLLQYKEQNPLPWKETAVNREGEKLLRLKERKKMRRKEKKSRQKNVIEKLHAFRKSESFKKLTKKERRAFRRKEKRLRLKEVKLLQRKERSSIRKKEKILWEIMRKLVKKGKIIEQKSLLKSVHRKETTRKIRVANKDKKVVMISKERHSKRQENQHVIDFSLAFVLWLLLRERYHVPLHDNKKDKRLLRRKELKKNASTHWLLFAIIWHLAMIRESCSAGYKKKQIPVQKQKIVQSALLPTTGIIFAFHP